MFAALTINSNLVVGATWRGYICTAVNTKTRSEVFDGTRLQPFMLNLTFSIIMLIEMPGWACCTLLLESLLSYSVLLSYRKRTKILLKIQSFMCLSNHKWAIINFVSFGYLYARKGKPNPVVSHSFEIIQRFSTEDRKTSPKFI